MYSYLYNYSVAHVELGLNCSIVGWVVEYPSLSCRSSLCIYTSACILLPSHSDRPRQSMASAASVNPSSWSPTCQAKFINLRLPTANPGHNLTTDGLMPLPPAPPCFKVEPAGHLHHQRKILKLSFHFNIETGGQGELDAPNQC